MSSCNHNTGCRCITCAQAFNCHPKPCCMRRPQPCCMQNFCCKPMFCCGATPCTPKRSDTDMDMDMDTDTEPARRKYVMSENTCRGICCRTKFNEEDHGKTDRPDDADLTDSTKSGQSRRSSVGAKDESRTHAAKNDQDTPAFSYPRHCGQCNNSRRLCCCSNAAYSGSARNESKPCRGYIICNGASMAGRNPEFNNANQDRQYSDTAGATDSRHPCGKACEVTRRYPCSRPCVGFPKASGQPKRPSPSKKGGRAANGRNGKGSITSGTSRRTDGSGFEEKAPGSTLPISDLAKGATYSEFMGPTAINLSENERLIDPSNKPSGLSNAITYSEFDGPIVISVISAFPNTETEQLGSISEGIVNSAMNGAENPRSISEAVGFGKPATQDEIELPHGANNNAGNELSNIKISNTSGNNDEGERPRVVENRYSDGANSAPSIANRGPSGIMNMKGSHASFFSNVETPRAAGGSSIRSSTNRGAYGSKYRMVGDSRSLVPKYSGISFIETIVPKIAAALPNLEMTFPQLLIRQVGEFADLRNHQQSELRYLKDQPISLMLRKEIERLLGKQQEEQPQLEAIHRSQIAAWKATNGSRESGLTVRRSANEYTLINLRGDILEHGEDSCIIDENGTPVLGPDGRRLYGPVMGSKGTPLVDMNNAIVDQLGNTVLGPDSQPIYAPRLDHEGRLVLCRDGEVMGANGCAIINAEGKMIFLGDTKRVVYQNESFI